MSENDNLSDIDEEEIDDELNLPKILSSISFEDKKELYKFKITHSEFEWEEEIMRRTEALARKVDMERLKKMAKGTSQPKLTEIKSLTKKKKNVKSDESESAQEEGEEEDNNSSDDEWLNNPSNSKKKDMDLDEKLDGSDEDEEIDEDDELFDSEEEEAISKRFNNQKSSKRSSTVSDSDDDFDLKTKKKGKRLGVGSTKKNKRKASKNDGSGEDDEFIDNDFSDRSELEFDILGEESDLFGNDINIGKIKSRSRATRLPSKKISKNADEEKEQESESEEDLSDESPPAEHFDYLNIQMRRFAILKILDEPYLEKAIKGTFVRLFIDQINGQPVYRLCEIVGVEKNKKPYSVSGIPKMITTRLSVSLAGNIRKHQRIDMVSNSRVTPDEFLFFKNKMEESGLPLLTKNQAAHRKKRILRSFNHTYTDKEINEMIGQKNSLINVSLSDFTTSLNRLKEKQEHARKEKDFDLLEKVEKEIEKLESQNLKQKEVYDKLAKKQLDINRKNRQNNVSRDIEAGMRKKMEDMEAAAKGLVSNSVADPFIRRETRPKTLWNTGKSLEERRQALETGESVPEDEAAQEEKTKDQVIEQSAIKAKADDSWVFEGEISLEKLRSRVKKRLGVDPFEHAHISKRQKYLEKVCKNIPPKDSEERKKMRGNNKSLEEALAHIRQ